MSKRSYRFAILCVSFTIVNTSAIAAQTSQLYCHIQSQCFDDARNECKDIENQQSDLLFTLQMSVDRNLFGAVADITAQKSYAVEVNRLILPKTQTVAGTLIDWEDDKSRFLMQYRGHNFDLNVFSKTEPKIVFSYSLNCKRQEHRLI